MDTAAATRNDVPGLTRRSRRRRAFLFGDCAPEEMGAFLEIGALDDPTVLKQEADVDYADYFTQAALVERHRDNPKRNWERIVPVDHVLAERGLDTIPPRYDWVIANHVLEHVPNPILWLRILHRLTGPRGRVFLSLPDRRYTFDYHKAETDAVDWIAAYERGAEMPDRYTIMRNLFYHCVNRAESAWAGVPARYPAARPSIMEARERAEALAETYHDTHCSVFTSDSFCTLITDLGDPGLVPWRVARLQPVAQDTAEFRVVLEKL